MTEYESLLKLNFFKGLPESFHHIDSGFFGLAGHVVVECINKIRQGTEMIHSGEIHTSRSNFVE